MTVHEESAGREWAAGLLLLAAGVGTRLFFASLYPSLPFWDFLQIVHFGELLRDHGPFAPGWYWTQYNPGLPVMLSVLFRLFPVDSIATARTATAIATGLCPLIPFLTWRRVLAFRWRCLAGLLLALWPGQIFFAGAPALDNWVLLPTVALASLAVRRLLDPTDGGHPLASGLLYGASFAIRQEMTVVLLPLVLAAATAHRRDAAGRTGRYLAIVAAVAAATFLAIGLQRREATGRFRAGSEHSALSLFGSFMPGSSVGGWIDGRGYAAAVDPSFSDGRIYGSQRELLRLTWAEARRRPVFHLARVAAWIPRLALNADTDNLFWIVGGERALPPDRQEAGRKFEKRWAPRLRVELALVHGLFAATVLAGWRGRAGRVGGRRAPPVMGVSVSILVLAAAVALKFLIHAFVAPVGRGVVPAIAMELLAIPLGLALLWERPAGARLRYAAVAAAAAMVVLLATPPLAAAVIRHDSPVLPGVRAFTLHASPECEVRCRIESGVLVGLSGKWAAPAAGESGSVARVACELPVVGAEETLVLQVRDPASASGFATLPTMSVRVDGQETPLHALPAGAAAGWREAEMPGPACGESRRGSDVVLEMRGAPPARDGGAGAGQPVSFTFAFERRARTGEPPLP